MVPSSQTTSPSPTGKLDIKQIMAFLPHRYPFLLVDGITSLEQFNYVEAFKHVTINEPFFQGHFPNLPVMPGVLIVEAMAQAGAFLVYDRDNADLFADNVFVFAGIENVKFRRPVVPGDRLDLRCDLIRKRMQLWKMRATARVGDALAAEAELSAAIVPREGFE